MPFCAETHTAAGSAAGSSFGGACAARAWALRRAAHRVGQRDVQRALAGHSFALLLERVDQRPAVLARQPLEEGGHAHCAARSEALFDSRQGGELLIDYRSRSSSRQYMYGWCDN